MSMPVKRFTYRRLPGLQFRVLLSIGTVLGLAGWSLLQSSRAEAAESAASAPAEAVSAVEPVEADAILTPAPPSATPAESADASAAGADAATASLPPTAQDSDAFEGLVLEALDQPTDLNVQEMPIRQALDQLAASTGIPIRLAPGCVSFLPYGSQTKLSATIEKRPLRESLTALLRPLGLEFVPIQKEVIVQPMPVLVRMGRRVTWDELASLEKLSAQPMTPELFVSLRFQFQDGTGDAKDSREQLGKAVAGVGEGPAAQVLERACDQCDWTWYPDGQVIAILTKAHQVERQLERRITLRYAQVSLPEALTDLANRAGTLLRLDPGVLSSLPPQVAERFSLSMENATVRQALEVITGETGLDYVVEADGVRITHQGAGGKASATSTTLASGTVTAQVEATAQATAAALRSNSIIGQLTFPLPDGSSFSFFVREGDLPPELNAMRQAKIDRTINQIRQKLHGEQQQD